jgi:hypothetical protein
MIEVLVITGVIIAFTVVVALVLPCEACRLRRERMREAYARWQAAKSQRGS